MPFQAVPDTAQLQFKLRGTSNGQFPGLPWFFSIYVRDTVGTWDATQLQKLAAYGATWWDTGKPGGNAGRTLASASWELLETQATDLTQVGGLFAATTPANPVGSRSGDPLPPSVPAVIQISGDPGALPQKGRIFWSGFVETDCTGDDYILASRTELRDAFNALRNGLDSPADGGDLNWTMVLVSRNEGTIPDPEPPRIAVRRAVAVTNGTSGSIAVRARVGAQRNRRTPV